MHPTTPVSHEFSKLYFTIVNSALVDVSKSSYSLSWYVRRKARRLSLVLHLPVNSSLLEWDCSFLFMFRQIAEMVLREKIYKKDYFLLRWWSIKSVPEISLPPCISPSQGLWIWLLNGAWQHNEDVGFGKKIQQAEEFLIMTFDYRFKRSLFYD